MASTGLEGDFDALCQQYETWIIQYISARFESPLYMVWLSDTTDDKDKFILSKENKIIAATTPMRMLDAMKDLEIEFPDNEKTKDWLIRAYLSDPAPFSVLDIKLIEESISRKDMNHTFLEEGINFINIFGDLGHQLDDEDLLDLTWDNAARDLWDFYYDNIFWPRWGHEDTFDETKVPKFEPDYEELKEDFEVLIQEFESRIEIR